MKKEIKEKIDKLTAEWWGEYGPAIRRQAFADQILELFGQEKEKLYNYCFKKCGEECEEAIRQERTKDCQKFIDALIWCSGSDDFQVGGKARKG